jgi:hypothetical protein
MTYNEHNPTFWSLALASLCVLAILAPIGQLAARAAGY